MPQIALAWPLGRLGACYGHARAMCKTNEGVGGGYFQFFKVAGRGSAHSKRLTCGGFGAFKMVTRARGLAIELEKQMESNDGHARADNRKTQVFTGFSVHFRTFSYISGIVGRSTASTRRGNYVSFMSWPGASGACYT